MERIAALSIGTKLMLASGSLLFCDLFLTWQTLPQRFGRRFEVTASLDGWDRVGLVVGLLALALLALVVVRSTDAELSPDAPWNGITLGLASLVLAVTTLKNVTDGRSAWAAYAGVALAAVMVAGAYLDRDRPPPESKPIEAGNWRPRVRAPAGRPELSSGRSPRASAELEPDQTRSASRW
jgi:hypothetical protein